MSPSHAPSPPSSQPRPLTFEDLWRLDRLGAPAPSPDGTRLVVPVASVYWPDDLPDSEPADESEARKDPEPENRTRTDLWLVELGGPGLETPQPARRLTWDGGSRAAWSPCGRWIYFTRKRSMPVDQQSDTKGDRPRQLWRLPMDGPGEAERLTSMPTDVSQPKPLADGRHVAFVADSWATLVPGAAPESAHDLKALEKRVAEANDDPVQARVTDRRLVRYWDEYRTDGRVPHVWILDLESGTVRDAMAGVDGLLHFMDFRWDMHPEGTQIAYSRNATEPPWQSVRMEIVFQELVLDALFDGGTASAPRSAPCTDESAWDNCPTYLPDGRLVFLRNPRPNVSADFSRLMVWDPADRPETARELLPAWDGDAGVPEVRPEGDEVVFLAEHQGRQHVYSARVDAAAGRVEPTRLDELGLESGSVVSARPVAGGRVACLHQSFHHPSKLWLLGPCAASVRLGDWNAGRLDAVDFGSNEPESVTFAVPRVDGESESETDDVQMFVLHPPGFDSSERDPKKRYPLVLLLHGGPHSAWLDSFHMRWNASLFAASGRVVVALNPHGSTGFGQAYAESIVGRHADQPFADAMAAVDLLVARGYVDESRMAVAGGSYGGFLTSWVIGHTHRFAAAVCHAGVYDLMAQFASDYTWSRGNNYGAEPWDDPAAIDRQSPSRFADAFDTPTLVLHGEKDFRVPVTQGINLYQVLQGKGVPSKLVVFPRENHWILKPRAARLWWREVEGWLDRWIGSGPS